MIRNIEVQVRISKEFHKFVHIFETEESQGLIFAESVGSRRIIEVPDVDSSILSRAPSRAITPIGEHRNARSSDQDYRSYAVSYEQSISSKKIRPGKLNKCKFYAD